MNLFQRVCDDEEDYWRVRNFLREVFVANGRLENSWHVARLDHWRWHLIETCHITPPFTQVTAVWETAAGELAAVLHPFGDGEIRLHIHPRFRSVAQEAEIFAYAGEHLAAETARGKIVIVPVLADDTLRQEALTSLGFSRQPGWNHHYWRDLAAPIPTAPLPAGYRLRAMGDESEYPARSWCSWRAFHADEPDSNYDGDYSWYGNMQTAPLYRRDLDVVAAAPDGSIAAFCTCAYDDYTRSAVTVLVGVAAEHWRRGLGKAVVLEGMRRLKRLGCTRVFATAAEKPADALYRAVMHTHRVTDTWVNWSGLTQKPSTAGD
ncbi:MAG: GNAT family N-acetyltransferase [Anaerolineales bacterium]|nr:GNAT family N-acetyltransferase [Anaerolineales bacterium]MCB8983643.1 GNAT family N-acetyltransferase [Ardenticatenaceae bacterium]